VTKKRLTAAVIAVTLVLFLIVEFSLIAIGSPTYSRVIQEKTGQNPIGYVIGFIMGLLTSHLSGF